MARQHTLTDYDDDADAAGSGHTPGGSPPRVKRKGVVESPTSRGKPAGFLGYDYENQVRVYTTRRTDYHYYRNGDGYAISDSILHTLSKTGASRILCHHKDSGDVYVYGIHQYQNQGHSVPQSALLDDDDPQTYVPVEDALYVYEDYADRLFYESFDVAMNRLSQKAWW